jgi:xylulokinase
MALIGLDIGTTGCKAIVFTASGQILGQSAREYGISSPQPGWAEQDAEQVWALASNALSDAIEAARSMCPVHDPPTALAISCQGEAVIPVDRSGKALRPAILGMDTRTRSENEFLANQYGAETLFERTGVPVHTINTLPKLLWLQRHEPDIWRSAAQFLLYEDFFLRRLGGKAVISPCLASRTQMMDIGTGDWAGDILQECGIERSRLAEVARGKGGIVGRLRPEPAGELGVEAGLVLVSGGHDQACAALGSGVTRPGLAMVSTGTAEVVEVAMETPALHPILRKGNISIYRHVVPNLYLAMTLNHSGGLLLRWYRDTFGAAELEEAQRTGQDAYDLLLAGAPDEPTPLMVLPHFSGSGTPWLDTDSKGAVLGLSFSTDRSQLAKAILEGLTFELRINLDLLQEAGIEISALHAVGGGARSPVWLQLKADICQKPLQTPQVTESACLGAALAAGVGVGVYGDFAEAVAQNVTWKLRFEPDPAMASAYDERYELFTRLYPLLADFQHRL